MLISKFNKLIHNKVIWAAFAILVSLSMVGFFAPSMRGGGGSRQANAIGTLFGKPVTRDELARARLYVQAFQPAQGGEAEQKMIQDEAWRRMANRRFAESLGISVSDQEIADAISRDPSFAVNGVFNPQRYQQLVESQIGVTRELFEDYLRDELLMQKVQAMIGTSLWIAPYELEQSVSRFTDQFTLDYITLSQSNLVSEITPANEEIRQFYDDHPSLFNAPELRSVFYVEWPVAEIAKTVNVSEEQIEAEYDRNIEAYSVTDTNTMAVTYTPLEEVSDELREQIATREGLGIAGEYAMQFIDALSMMDYGDPVSIHSVAKEQGMNVYTSELFNATEAIPGIDAGSEFNRAAFELDPADPATSYSRTVIGNNAVYVMAWHTNRPSFLQPFEDVKELATELTTRELEQEAFETRLNEIHEKLAEAIKQGDEFKSTATEMGFPVTNVGPFSVYSADPEDIPFFSDIAPAVLPMHTGELTAPIALADESLIVYVATREPGDPAEAEAIKPDISQMLQSSRMRMHIASWSRALLAAARGNEESDSDTDE